MKIYLPLLYTEKVKKPDKNYFLRNIIGEDFIVLLLTFAYDSVDFWQTAIVLFLLQISFWCVYELGYIENDIIGEKFETQPILTSYYNSIKYSFKPWQIWLWSFILSAIAVLIILLDTESTTMPSITLDSNHWGNIAKNYLTWITFLASSRFIFYIYNHLNKQSRIWLYSLLQSCRYGGYLLLFTVSTTSLMLLISKILTRSIQYIIYRYVGGQNDSWPIEFPKYFFCFTTFILLTGLVAINERDLSLILNYQLLPITFFCLARGYKNFYKVSSQLSLVSKDGSSRVT